MTAETKAMTDERLKETERNRRLASIRLGAVSATTHPAQVEQLGFTRSSLAQCNVDSRDLHRDVVRLRKERRTLLEFIADQGLVCPGWWD